MEELNLVGDINTVEMLIETNRQLKIKMKKMQMEKDIELAKLRR